MALSERALTILARTGLSPAAAVVLSQALDEISDAGVIAGPITFSALGEGRMETDPGGSVSALAPTTFRANSTSITLGTSFTVVPGASVALTVPGTYRVAFYGRGQVDAPGKFCTYRLFDVTAGSALPDTEAVAGFDDAGTFTNSQNMCAMETFITITVPTTIRLEGKGSAATGCSSQDSTDGRTVITANRI